MDIELSDNAKKEIVKLNEKQQKLSVYYQNQAGQNEIGIEAALVSAAPTGTALTVAVSFKFSGHGITLFLS